MRLRSLLMATMVASAGAGACSLIYGLHDNLGPLDSGADASDASIDVGPNGCPADAAHTFCELFDEQPPWPADASMPTIVGNPTLLVDGGCDTPPRCLGMLGQTGYASRKLTTPQGVHHVTLELHARFDAIDSGVTPRTAWITLATATGKIELGTTFAHYGTIAGDFRVFLFFDDSDGGVNADALLQLTVGQWYDLVLDVDIDAKVVSLKSPSTALPVSHTFADFGVPSFAAADVESLGVNAGVDTGNAQTGATVDTIYVDVR